jgi:hypothetical protein
VACETSSVWSSYAGDIAKLEKQANKLCTRSKRITSILSIPAVALEGLFDRERRPQILPCVLAFASRTRGAAVGRLDEHS